MSLIIKQSVKTYNPTVKKFNMSRIVSAQSPFHKKVYNMQNPAYKVIYASTRIFPAKLKGLIAQWKASTKPTLNHPLKIKYSKFPVTPRVAITACWRF